MHLSLRASLVLAFLLGAACCIAQPVANFTATPTSGCAPLLVTFTSTSTGATSYSWSLGNGNTSVLQNPATTYNNPGTYNVTLTINNGAATITKTAYITVYASPTVSFTYSNSSGCIPLLSSFTGAATPNAPGTVTYSWYYGDGSPLGTGLSSSHLYTAPNTYSVTFTATNGAGCSASVTQNNIITAHPKPGGAFTANATTFCGQPATVNFTNSASSGASPYSVWWDFGDGNAGITTNNPTHTYTAGGSFTVKLVTLDAHGCIDTLVQTNYINVHVPNATFSASTVACIPRGYNCSDSAMFKNTTPGAINTTWDFGDGTIGSGDSAGHVYCLLPSVNSASFTVRMVTYSGGCYDTAYNTVNVRRTSAFTPTISPYPNCHVPATFTFSTLQAAFGTTWHWLSGGSDTGATVTKQYTAGMVDTVFVTATDSYGCKDTSKAPVPVFDPSIMILGQDHGCAPLTATYSAQLVNGGYPSLPVSYLWDFGDGSTTATSATATHTYSSYGTYNLSVKITTQNGCVFYDTIEVHVGTKVKPSFNAYPNPVCAGKTVYFQNTTNSPGTTYTWDVGDGAYTPVNVIDAIHTYVIPGIYTVKLISNNNGCEDTTIKTNWMVVNGPNANFVDTVLCDSGRRLIHLHNMSISATSQLWIFSDNTTDTSFSPYHVFPGNGTYTVTLTTYNSSTGCRDTLSLPVTVGKPSMSFTASDTTICKGDTVRIIPAYNGPTGATISIYVTNGLPVIGALSGAGASYFYMNTPGFQTVTMISYLNPSGPGAISGGCYDTLVRQNYILVSKPVAGFKAGPVIGCTPLFVTLTDTSHYTPGAMGRTRIWTYGNGNSSTTLNAAAAQTYLTAGKYTVKLVVIDTNGCKDSLTKTNYIEARHPVAAFSANYTTACLGQTLSFSNTSSGATGLSYKWDFGDGSADTARNPAHAYSTASSFTVRLIVTDSTGCSDTMTKAGYISTSRPTASFNMSDSLTVCPPLSVNFSSTSINTAYLDWDFGNSSVSVLPNPTTLFSAANIYRVRLIATDGAGCKDTAYRTVRVLGYAGALTYAPLAGCAPLTVNFTAIINNVSRIVWDFANGDTSLATGPATTYTYTTPGAYVPKLVFYDGKGCSASSIGLDTIKVDAVYPDFRVLPPCEKTLLQLVDASRSLFSPLASWRWEFGPGQVATGSSVARIYSAPGSYPVRLIVTNARGCTDTIDKNFTIFPLPVIKSSPDTTICPPDAIALGANGGVSYAWAPGATLSCTACTAPMASPAVPTTYTVTGTDSNGCQGKDTLHIGIQTKTTFSVASGGEICLGQQFHLAATGATVYSWSPGASLTHADSGSTYASPTATTTYIATAREGSCAADTHSVRVIVNPLPVIDAGADDRVIAGKSVALQASGTAIDHLLWKDDPSLSCTDCYAPYAAPKVTTTYYVTAYTTKGCIATDSVTVRVLCDGSQLFIPNTFTPNADGYNDYFYPRGQGIDFVKSFRIYSRWGELLFERNNLAVNEEYAGWNGTYNGQKLAPDVYVYIIEATCDNGEPIKWKGDISLIR